MSEQKGILVVFYSVSGNVRKFVKKTGLKNTLEIDSNNPFQEVNEPFILIAPTYIKHSIEQIWDFMEHKENASLCIGIAGSGNLNFNNLYCYTAQDLSDDFGAPVIFDFEFSGFKKDIRKFLDVVENLKIN